MTALSHLLPSSRTRLWQSPDGLMETGFIPEKQPYYYAALGQRTVTLGDIQSLIGFLTALQEDWPLVLLSSCTGFAATPAEEADGLVFYAGQYRALQQQHKQQGRLLLSYLHDVAVGGTYLMHGLSAHHRAAAPDTQFHDTVPTYPAVPLPQALERGLISAIVPPAEFQDWLHVYFKEAQP